MKLDETQSPVSFPVNVARLPQKGMPVVVNANAAQREALAEAHGLTSVEHYKADLLVTRWKRNGVKVSGRVQAQITQACIVTLEPVEATIDEDVEGVYLPEDSKLARQGFNAAGEILLDAEGPDGPETFTGDTIDVGALAEEFFGLAIDPYPRKTGVAVVSTDDDDIEPIESEFQKKLRLISKKL
ncbi:YceD family protein [Aminobacter sp. UC22_36]|uniref:YceD family protein n=1 Tax=Aminobacter sp. UC22_36 TaxID=3374549 RepID=UPI003757A8ED